MPTANEIRQQFIDFFVEKHGHTFVPSSPVVPHDDPTLLFANAGMNQFKDVFLGTGTRPYSRAVNTQKCIRAGGKHNDLDDVGKDTYHHTFFEMLGNWSFGDYFKKEAIEWAWELLTEVWGLDKERLHATVFKGDPAQGLEPDNEAAELWRTVTDIDPSHIHLCDAKDNFWEMGDTGPCGPCSEIHYDHTPDKSGIKLVNAGLPEVVEIWNLVFIQFNRDGDGTLTTLPAKHVDTGMGFERIAVVLQNKKSNYDTDIFTPVIDAIADLTGKEYDGSLNSMVDVGFRVIADHLRMATFAITDGARPDSKGRDSVVRSVIRRAVRFGYKYFDLREPFIFKLVPTVVQNMGDAFPELQKNSTRVEEIIRNEEQDFLKTIEKGLVEFQYAIFRSVLQLIAKKKNYEPFRVSDSAIGRVDRREKGMGAGSGDTFHATLWFKQNGEDVYQDLDGSPDDENSVENVLKKYDISQPLISGKEVFNLHTTFGFPPDLTRQMAEERGFTIDEEEYDRLMIEHEKISRGDEKGMVITAIKGDLPQTDDTPKYKKTNIKSKILGWVKDNMVGTTGQFETGAEIALLLDKTNFYAEQGGQVGDTGLIVGKNGTFEVENAQKLGDSVLHIGRVREGGIKSGERVECQVSEDRPHTMRNHTATHLLNWALRKVLGNHIEQKGSLVDAEKTRFDFSHDSALSAEQIAEIERLVNEQIYFDQDVIPVFMPLEEAQKIPTVRAVFGEKYPDPVRVLMIGAKKPEKITEENSVEFCGGTHVTHTGEIGPFKIISQEAVGKGVRRVTATTGRGAVEAVQTTAALLDEAAGKINCQPHELPGRIEALQAEIKELQKQVRKGAAADIQGAADKLFEAAEEANGAKLIIGELPAGPIEQLRNQIDRLRQKAGSAVVFVGWHDDDKVGLLAAATDDLVEKGVHAGKLIGQVAPLVGGKGGGKPTLAQAGGKDPTQLGAALAEAKRIVAAQV